MKLFHYLFDKRIRFMHAALNNLGARYESHRLTLHERFSTSMTGDESSPDEKSGVVQGDLTAHGCQAYSFFCFFCVGWSIDIILCGSCYM